MELLVVIAIIGILVALLLPATQAAREAARRASCVNRLRQVSLACLNHHDTKKRFPAATSNDFESAPDGNGITQLTSWGYVPQILPFMEGESLISLAHLDKYWGRPVNANFITTPLPEFRCPSQDSVEITYIDSTGGSTATEDSNLRTHYQGIMGAKHDCPASTTGYPQSTYTMANTPGRPIDCGAGGAASNGAIVPVVKVNLKDVTDGSSHTFLVGELSWSSGPSRVWAVGAASRVIQETHNYSSKNIAYPLNTAFRAAPGEPASGYPNNDMSFGSMHPSGAHFAMCDGSVQFVREDVDLNGVLKARASRKSEEVPTAAF